ncbi:MAG: ribosome biogenesis factor YjgA [Mariprofundaceae bacterium]|nr:ribosome biogenesis factor YjgA [Mariprofundaceae bacterium]
MLESEDFEDEFRPPSKSQRKRDVEALHELGKRLIELDVAKLQSLEVPSSLVEELKHAKGIQAHAAKKRQLKLIAKMLQSIDTTEIKKLFENRDHQHQKGVSEFHGIEKMRDHLISGGKSAMTSFLALCPNADRQKLNQLVRGALKEAQASKTPKSTRLLFLYLKEIADPQLLADHFGL